MIIHTVPFATWKTKATKDDEKDFITAWQVSIVFMPLMEAASNQKFHMKNIQKMCFSLFYQRGAN